MFVHVFGERSLVQLGHYCRCLAFLHCGPHCHFIYPSKLLWTKLVKSCFQHVFRFILVFFQRPFNIFRAFGSPFRSHFRSSTLPSMPGSLSRKRVWFLVPEVQKALHMQVGSRFAISNGLRIKIWISCMQFQDFRGFSIFGFFIYLVFSFECSVFAAASWYTFCRYVSCNVQCSRFLSSPVSTVVIMSLWSLPFGIVIWIIFSLWCLPLLKGMMFAELKPFPLETSGCISHTYCQIIFLAHLNSRALLVFVLLSQYVRQTLKSLLIDAWHLLIYLIWSSIVFHRLL